MFRLYFQLINLNLFSHILDFTLDAGQCEWGQGRRVIEIVTCLSTPRELLTIVAPLMTL